jgi:hypothetical protein
MKTTQHGPLDAGYAWALNVTNFENLDYYSEIARREFVSLLKQTL